MLESLAKLFYNPLFFWGLPLLIVAALAVCRHLPRGTPSNGKSDTEERDDDLL